MTPLPPPLDLRARDLIFYDFLNNVKTKQAIVWITVFGGFTFK